MKKKGGCYFTPQVVNSWYNQFSQQLNKCPLVGNLTLAAGQVIMCFSVELDSPSGYTKVS